MAFQLVIDAALGLICLCLMYAGPDFFISLVNYFCKRLHLENLSDKIFWLLGRPAGFKPNVNLSHFLGNMVLQLIDVWDQVTSALTKGRVLIVYAVGLQGIFGLSV